MIDLLVWVAVLAIVVILIWWVLSQLPLPEPARKIVTIVLVVVVAIIAIGFLLSVAGVGTPMRMR
jgi:heme A synthase